MMYALTYTNQLDAVRKKGNELAKAGQFPEMIEAWKASFKIKAVKPPVAYSDSQCSLALILFGSYDFQPFCDAIGLEVLASGTSCYQQVQDNPEALAKYRTVLPDVEILDAEGNGTGVFKFNQWYEIDAPIRS